LNGTITWTELQGVGYTIFDPFGMYDGSTTVTLPETGAYKVTARIGTVTSFTGDGRSDIAMNYSGGQSAHLAITKDDVSGSLAVNHVLETVITNAVPGDTITFSLSTSDGFPTELTGISGYLEVERIPTTTPLPRALLSAQPGALGVPNGLVDWSQGTSVRQYDPYSMWNGTTTLTATAVGQYLLSFRGWANQGSGVNARADWHINSSVVNTAENFSFAAGANQFNAMVQGLVDISSSTAYTTSIDTESSATVQTGLQPRDGLFEIELLPTGPQAAHCILQSDSVIFDNDPVVNFNVSPRVYDPFHMFDGYSKVVTPAAGYYRIIGRFWGNGGSGSNSSCQLVIRNPAFPGFATPLTADTAENNIMTVLGAVQDSTTLITLVHVPAGTVFELIFNQLQSGGRFNRSAFLEVKQLGAP